MGVLSDFHYGRPPPVSGGPTHTNRAGLAGSGGGYTLNCEEPSSLGPRYSVSVHQVHPAVGILAGLSPRRAPGRLV